MPEQFSGGRLGKAAQDPQQSRLATTGGAQERNDPSRFNRQVDGRDYLNALAIGLRIELFNAASLDDCFAQLRLSSLASIQDVKHGAVVSLPACNRILTIAIQPAIQAANSSGARAGVGSGIRSVNSARSASFSASSGVRTSPWTRHLQLPAFLLGVFMRASLPRPRTSCSGMTARLATDPCAARMKDQ